MWTVLEMCRKHQAFSISYNSAKDVPHFCKWGLRQITGGEHISRLVETLTEEVLPLAKLDQMRYKRIFAKSRIFDTACRIEIDMRFIENEVA